MHKLLEKKETGKRKMFQIAHDNCFVYSIINVIGLTKPIFKGEQPIEDLMFIWANQTAIPYLNRLK